MKKILTFWLLILTFLVSSACQPSARGEAEPGPLPPTAPPSPEAPEVPAAERYLIVYCSRSGNTATVAAYLQQQLGGDLLEVEPATPYEEDYQAMLTRAQEELDAIREGRYPAITTEGDNLSEYDVVLVGYPIWFGSMATPMQAFLHGHAGRLAGKRIALFATSGSSGMTTSTEEAATLCPQATLLRPTLLLTSASMSDYEERAQSWLNELNFEPSNDTEETMNENTILLTVSGNTLTVTLEENSSSAALLARLAEGPLSVRMDDYGDMEKVGALGFSLPRNDHSITTRPGDLILYQGNTLTLYYDTNSWSFTRLGHVDGMTTREEMLAALGGKGAVTVTLTRP